jgi:hypothetical protein
MLIAIWLAIAAAVLITTLGALIRRPRNWALRAVRRVRLAMSPRRHEDIERAIERIATELAMRRYYQEGNPDDIFYDDWLRWFTGDPNASVDYARKQQRDRARLTRGEFGLGEGTE